MPINIKSSLCLSYLLLVKWIIHHWALQPQTLIALIGDVFELELEYNWLLN